jgi:hypothetical protein
VVERNCSYEIEALAGDGRPGKVIRTEVVGVSFKLRGTEEVGKLLFPRQMGSLTVAKDGALIVVMKKVDGKWRWNPFGW